MCPDGYPIGLSPHLFLAALHHTCFTFGFSCFFVHFVAVLLCFITSFRPLLSFSAYFLLFRYCDIFFIFFSVYFKLLEY
jgi:hypothetical protein